MWRYRLMRGTVNGVEKGTHVIFGTIRWGISTDSTPGRHTPGRAATQPAAEAVAAREDAAVIEAQARERGIEANDAPLA